MNVTENTRATIVQSLRRKSMTQSELAEKMGMGKSWVTKLLNGTLKSLSDEHTDLLEEILDVSFFKLTKVDTLSPMARLLGERMKDNPALEEIMTSLVRMTDDSLHHELPYIPTKDLVDFGKEIMRAAHEDPDKPGKIGRIAITWLADRLQKLKSKS